ncbi:MAG: helicase-related protein, partial [Caulobacterales bacterium]
MSKIKAVLGPTNTGKTHLAVERMLGHGSGAIGLPLRLLAREIYDRVVKAKGERAAALITGEEKIAPPTARFFVCTAEAMPQEMPLDFVAVDEIQLAADLERGHIFTDRLLNMRGMHETMLLGSDTMRAAVRRLVPKAAMDKRERFSKLTYSGPRKITKLARRTAIVAFSAEEVYAIAELLRRHRGGAAVVMGALSPRTRNAQVELYQSGEVDYLVATDAIGMGLNMDVDHVAFASISKFDGRRPRRLRADEIAQIAGRAGRYQNDGTFGETGDCADMDPEIVERVEAHEFDPVEALEWRNEQLDFSSLAALRNSLAAPPPDSILRRVRGADDEAAFEALLDVDDIRDRLTSPFALRRLWQVCQTPDFRKVTQDEHIRLVGQLALRLLNNNGHLPDEFLARQLDRLDRDDGDLDAVQQRLAHVRTWTYAANRGDWMHDPEHWRGRTRAIEDKLSDLLHERLTQRFIDRRTSALLRGLKREDVVLSGIDEQGEVTVEGHYVGKLDGLVFRADPRADGLAERALRNAVLRALRPEVARRLWRVAGADDEAFTLGDDGIIRCFGDSVARLGKSANPLSPIATLIGGDLGPDDAQARARARVEAWLASEAHSALAALAHLEAALKSGALRGLARGLAFRLTEAGGVLDRARLAADIDSLSTAERRALKANGVRFGAFSLYLSALLKPRAARLFALLHHATTGQTLFLPPPSAVSVPINPAVSLAAYSAAGFRPVGPRAVRVDALERLADAIRALREAPKANADTDAPMAQPAKKPAGDFPAKPELAALLGAPSRDLEPILSALGFKRTRKGEPTQPALYRPMQRPSSAQRAPVAEASSGLSSPGSPFSALSALRPTPPVAAKRKRRRRARPS